MKRKVLCLFLSVFMMLGMCIAAYAYTTISGSKNCYNDDYSESLDGGYSDKFWAKSDGKTAHTSITNSGSVTRYMICSVSEVNIYTNTVINSASDSADVSTQDSVDSGKIDRAKGYTRYKYVHRGYVYGGASNTPTVDYFEYTIYQNNGT